MIVIDFEASMHTKSIRGASSSPSPTPLSFWFLFASYNAALFTFLHEFYAIFYVLFFFCLCDHFFNLISFSESLLDRGKKMYRNWKEYEEKKTRERRKGKKLNSSMVKTISNEQHGTMHAKWIELLEYALFCDSFRLCSLVFVRSFVHRLRLVIDNRYRLCTSIAVLNALLNEVCTSFLRSIFWLFSHLVSCMLLSTSISRVVCRLCQSRTTPYTAHGARRNRPATWRFVFLFAFTVSSMEWQKGCRPLKVDLYIPWCNTDYFLSHHRVALLQFMFVLIVFFPFLCILFTIRFASWLQFFFVVFYFCFLARFKGV